MWEIANSSKMSAAFVVKAIKQQKIFVTLVKVSVALDEGTANFLNFSERKYEKYFRHLEILEVVNALS